MAEYYSKPHMYDDIIGMEHHQSKERPHMTMHDRAAQFAPFAALTGHDEAISETARVTDEKLELTESAVEDINQKLRLLAEHPEAKQRVSVTYFREDKRKKGGVYLTDIGYIRRIDAEEAFIILDSGMKIAMQDIAWIEFCE